MIVYLYYYIIIVLFYIQLQVPNTPKKWLETANDFESKWNFPHTLGSMDGKHVVIQAPISTGVNILTINLHSVLSYLLLSMRTIISYSSMQVAKEEFQTQVYFRIVNLIKD